MTGAIHLHYDLGRQSLTFTAASAGAILRFLPSGGVMWEPWDGGPVAEPTWTVSAPLSAEASEEARRTLVFLERLALDTP